jgi:hypothetical protein
MLQSTELERMDLDIFEGLKEAILTGTCKNLNFPRLPASYGSGTIRITPSGAYAPWGTKARLTKKRLCERLRIAATASWAAGAGVIGSSGQESVNP